MKNKELTNMIREIKTLAINQKSKFWKRVATELEKPRKNMRVVNVGKLKRVVRKGEIAVIPGKVVGSGKYDGDIAAYQFSETVKNNNKTMDLDELMKKCPKGQKCRIIG
ncbi:MAG: 50S ribosomal protein L18e [Nanoarchaeota archaeon]|nr:50S ribosomal protein L18e [Nanoarchaeota archaeon]